MTIKTARDFFTAVSKLAGVDPAIIAYAVDALAKLDTKNANRANTPSAKAHRAEVDSFRAEVLAIFTADPALFATAGDIAGILGVTVPKASAALVALAKSGALVATKFKVKACKAQGIKGGEKTGYQLAPVPESETEPETGAE